MFNGIFVNSEENNFHIQDPRVKISIICFWFKKKIKIEAICMHFFICHLECNFLYDAFRFDVSCTVVPLINILLDAKLINTHKTVENNLIFFFSFTKKMQEMHFLKKKKCFI